MALSGFNRRLCGLDPGAADGDSGFEVEVCVEVTEPYKLHFEYICY